MPWEDAYFRHTDNNRFVNTNCNEWFGVKAEDQRDFSSKGASLSFTREIGGAGLGFGKRPYLHTDYHEMLKSTTDKEAFDRIAARGYFSGRAMLERPYGSKHYQDMKYQKPVTPLLSKSSPELSLERPEFEMPEGITMEQPMWIRGNFCSATISRMKICLENSSTAEGIELYDGIVGTYTKEALVDSKRINILVYNLYQIRQTTPHFWVFVFDSSTSSWRAPTVAEGGTLSTPITIKPGASILGNISCLYGVQDFTEYTSVDLDSGISSIISDTITYAGACDGETTYVYKPLDAGWMGSNGVKMKLNPGGTPTGSPFPINWGTSISVGNPQNTNGSLSLYVVPATDNTIGLRERESDGTEHVASGSFGAPSWPIWFNVYIASGVLHAKAYSDEFVTYLGEVTLTLNESLPYSYIYAYSTEVAKAGTNCAGGTVEDYNIYAL